MNLKSFFLALALASSAASLWAAAPQVIAHRGHWRPEGASQNSVRALVKADSIGGVYGAELDVWMSRDGVLFVNHDAHLSGVELQNAPADSIFPLTLKNGELIPTLEKYLSVARGLSVRLILELKSHKDKDQERRAVEKILALVDSLGLAPRMEYISFSKDAVVNFRALAPEGTPVYYLYSGLNPAQIKELDLTGLDYNIGAMRKNPEWIQQAHDLGLKVNIWTVDRPEDIQWCIDNGADFITTNEPELTRSLVNP